MFEKFIGQLENNLETSQAVPHLNYIDKDDQVGNQDEQISFEKPI